MLDEILDHLTKVKKSGSGYMACCPVHNDRSPSMSLTEKDGKVLINCFGCGANGLEVMNALGLPAKMLFSGEFTPTRMSKRLESDLRSDALVLAFYEASVSNNQKLTYNDYKRVKLARERIKILGDQYAGESL